MYGLLITLGILFSLILAEVLAKQRELDTGILWGGSFWVMLFGIVGARVYHVTHYWEFYSANPEKILFVWDGGLGILGAILGGLFATVIYLKLKKVSVLKWLDIIGVVFPLGQAIGRWGNYFNQELYGSPTSLAWGIYISPENRLTPYERYTNFHPLFLYESLLNSILFLMLFALFKLRKDLPKGVIFFTYLIGYCTIRIFLEELRITSWETAGINTAQGLCIFISIASIFSLKRIKNTKSL